VSRDSDNALAIARVAAQVQTIAQARAVLGAVASTLQQAYGRLDELHNVAGQRDEMRSRLDAVNAFAQRTYAIWTDDPDLQDQEISSTNASRVGVCMAQASNALKDVQELAGQDFWNFAEILQDSLAATGAMAGRATQSVTNAIAAGGSAFVTAAWSTILVVAIAGGIYFFRRPIVAALGKVAS